MEYECRTYVVCCHQRSVGVGERCIIVVVVVCCCGSGSRILCIVNARVAPVAETVVRIDAGEGNFGFLTVGADVLCLEGDDCLVRATFAVDEDLVACFPCGLAGIADRHLSVGLGKGECEGMNLADCHFGCGDLFLLARSQKAYCEHCECRYFEYILHTVNCYRLFYHVNPEIGS